MTVSYNAALKTTRMTAVITAIDANASPATMEIATAAYALVLATITLADPSFTESGGVITLAGAPKSDASADATGTAAVARIKDGAGTVIVTGLTCGVGTGDVQMNTLDLTAGQQFTISSGTIAHSA